MSDEPDKPHNLTAEELVRLKHSLGKSITWGKSDLNALEVEELTKLDRNDYAEIRKDYAKWRPWSWNLYFVSVFVGLLVASYFLRGLVRILAEVGAISCLYFVGKREGHAEGYIDGYDAGHEAGVYKVLGVKNEEIAEMAKKATEMKVDEMLVGRMDERKAKESIE